MHVLVLVWRKGCGKTHIAQLLEKELPITQPFRRWKHCNWFGKGKWRIRRFIQKRLISAIVLRRNSRQDERNCSCSAGGWRQCDHDNWNDRRGARDVRFLERIGAFRPGASRSGTIQSSVSTCVERIQSRDASRQEDVSAEMIERYHAATDALDWNWDLKVMNEAPFSNEVILEEISNSLNSGNK